MKEICYTVKEIDAMIANYHLLSSGYEISSMRLRKKDLDEAILLLKGEEREMITDLIAGLSVKEIAEKEGINKKKMNYYYGLRKMVFEKLFYILNTGNDPEKAGGNHR